MCRSPGEDWQASCLRKPCPPCLLSVERAAGFGLSSSKPLRFHQRQFLQTISSLPHGSGTALPIVETSALVQPACPCSATIEYRASALVPSPVMGACCSWDWTTCRHTLGSGREPFKSSCPVRHHRQGKVPKEISSAAQKIKFELHFSETLLSVAWD